MGRIEMDRKFLSSAHLKWIAIITMFIDHIGASLIETNYQYMPTEHLALVKQIDYWIRAVGRLAFPLFIFMLIEGFFYTHSRARYLGRLLLFAAISEIPFDLAFFVRRDELDAGIFYNMSYQNVFFTLVLGMIAMICMEWVITKVWEGRSSGRILRGIVCVAACAAIVSALALLSDELCTDYRISGVVAISMGYLVSRALRSGKLPRRETTPDFKETAPDSAETAPDAASNVPDSTETLPGSAATVGAYLPAATRHVWVLAAILIPLILKNSFEAVAVCDLALILRYSGKKGNMHMSKWFFYAFYPLHLALFAAIRFLIV